MIVIFLTESGGGFGQIEDDAEILEEDEDNDSDCEVTISEDFTYDEINRDLIEEATWIDESFITTQKTDLLDTDSFFFFIKDFFTKSSFGLFDFFYKKKK